MVLLPTVQRLIAEGGGSDVNITSTVAFAAYHNTTQSISDATDTKVSFNTEVFDEGSDFASSEFTAPIAGIYHFSGGVQYANLGSGSRVRIEVRVNGTRRFKGEDKEVGSTGVFQVSVSGTTKLSASDVVTIYTYQDSAGSQTVNGSEGITWFSGHLVGKV